VSENKYEHEARVNGVAKIGDRVRFYGEYNKHGRVSIVVELPHEPSVCYRLVYEENPLDIPVYGDLRDPGYSFAENFEAEDKPELPQHALKLIHPEFFKK
jgi:hypothetical protein